MGNEKGDSMTAAKPRLSPRRRWYAQRVLDFVNAEAARLGTAVPFLPNIFLVCEQKCGFNWININLALDDLYHFRFVDISLRDDGVQIVSPLATSLEDAT